MMKQKLKSIKKFFKKTNIFSYIFMVIGLLSVGFMYYFWHKVDPKLESFDIAIGVDNPMLACFIGILIFGTSFLVCFFINIVNKIRMLTLLLKLEEDTQKLKTALIIDIVFSFLINVLVVTIFDWFIYSLVKKLTTEDKKQTPEYEQQMKENKPL